MSRFKYAVGTKLIYEVRDAWMCTRLSISRGTNVYGVIIKTISGCPEPYIINWYKKPSRQGRHLRQARYSSGFISRGIKRGNIEIELEPREAVLEWAAHYA